VPRYRWSTAILTHLAQEPDRRIRSPSNMSSPLSVIPVVLLAALALAACGDESSSGTDPSTLDVASRTFLGDDVTVDGEPMPLVKGSQLRLSFETDSIGASGGCNSMSGAATWADGTLRVADGSLATTEMACDAPLMDQDTWFAKILTAAPTLTHDGDSLTLATDSTVIVLTDEEVVTPDASLTGTPWTLESIATGNTVGTVPAGVRATLEFNDDGTLAAHLGCNTGRGDYTASDTSITFGPIATTRMACEPPASDVEQAMSEVLQGEVSFSIDGSNLTFTPAKGADAGATQLTFGA